MRTFQPFFSKSDYFCQKCALLGSKKNKLKAPLAFESRTNVLLGAHYYSATHGIKKYTLV